MFDDDDFTSNGHVAPEMPSLAARWLLFRMRRLFLILHYLIYRIIFKSGRPPLLFPRRPFLAGA